VSSLFGMHSSSGAALGGGGACGEDEAFDVEDEAAAALWDLDDLEVERLRAAPSQSQPGDSAGGVSGLFGGPAAPGGAAKAGGEGRRVWRAGSGRMARCCGVGRTLAACGGY
jgi:hypothetical protein